MLQPQEYSETAITLKELRVYRGKDIEVVEQQEQFFKEKEYYFGGLIKDTTTTWVSEHDIGGNGS